MKASTRIDQILQVIELSQRTPETCRAVSQEEMASALGECLDELRLLEVAKGTGPRAEDARRKLQRGWL